MSRFTTLAELQRASRKKRALTTSEAARLTGYAPDHIDAADDLRILAALPGNRLERLRGDREGQWSIRINDQWRICFAWREGDTYHVEIADYH